MAVIHFTYPTKHHIISHSGITSLPFSLHNYSLLDSVYGAAIDAHRRAGNSVRALVSSIHGRCVQLLIHMYTPTLSYTHACKCTHLHVHVHTERHTNVYKHTYSHLIKR